MARSKPIHWPGTIALGAALCAPLLGLAPLGCKGCGPDRSAGHDAGTSSASAASAKTAATPSASSSASQPQVAAEPRCPPDMVRVQKHYCVDRYEDVILDVPSGRLTSPYYTPSKKLASYAAEIWESKRFEVGDAQAQAMPLPELPAWERERDVQPKAVSRKAVVPNGYVTGVLADLACRNAGKRLCTYDEWRTACRGEQDRQFPYGADYKQGACNVFREAHPGAILHDDVTTGHSDPRLNLVTFHGQPLLRKTGETPACKSDWESDAIYDMVGNLDEWVQHPKGMFAGGFYARSAKEGCERKTTAHPKEYADYSTGVRCCADLPSAGSEPSAPSGPGTEPAPLTP